MSHVTARESNYLPLIRAMVARGELPRKGWDRVVDVGHDGWCGLLHGGHICDCEPTVTAKPNVPARKY